MKNEETNFICEEKTLLKLDEYLKHKRFNEIFHKYDPFELRRKLKTPIPIKNSNFSNINHNIFNFIVSYLTIKEIRYLIFSLKNMKLVNILHRAFYEKISSSIINETHIFDVSFFPKMFIENIKFPIPFRNFVTFLKTYTQLSQSHNMIGENLTIQDMLYIPDNKTVVIVFSPNKIIIKKESGLQRIQFAGKTILRIMHVSNYKNGKFIFVQFTNEIRVLNIGNLTTDFIVKVDSRDLIYSHNPGTLIVLSTKDSLIKFREDEDKALVKDKEFMLNKKINDKVEMRLLSEFNEKLLFIICGNSIQILNVDWFKTIGSLEGHTDTIIEFFFSKTFNNRDDTLISVSKNNEVKIWSIREARCLNSYEIDNKYSFDRILYVPEIRYDCFFICKSNQNSGLLFLKGKNDDKHKFNYVPLEIYQKNEEPDNLISFPKENLIYTFVNSSNNLSSKLELKIFGLSKSLKLKEYSCEIN